MIVSRLDHRATLPAFGVVVLQLLIMVAALFAIQGQGLALAVLVGAIALVMAAAALAVPHWLVVLAPLFVVLPIAFLTFYPYEWMLMAGLGGAALLYASGRRTWAAPSPMEIIWILYLAWTCVTVTQSANTYAALQGMSRILIAGMAFVAGYRVLGQRRSRSLVRVMALLAIVVALQLLGNIVVRGFTMDLVTSRLATVTDLGWGFSNYVAAVASLAAASAIFLLVFSTGYDRLLGVAGIFGALLVQAITLSRGGSLALFLGLLLAGLVEVRRRLFVVLLLTAVVVTGFVLSPLGVAVLERFSTPQGFASIGARFIFYQEAWSIWRAHWLAGVGPDQIPFHTPLYIGANPHNIVLKQLADFGVVGLALYLGLIGILVRTAVRARLQARSREGRALAVAMLIALGVALANSLYEPTLTGNVYGFLFWLLMGTLKRRADLTLQDTSAATT